MTAVEPPQTLYNQPATHFAMPLYLRPDTEVEPQVILELAEFFLSNLLFPSTRLTALHTKRPGDGARLNLGEFTRTRWDAARKKILRGEYAVVEIRGEIPDFPRQKIWFSLPVNPPGGDERLVAGTIEVLCSVSYLRHLSASPERVEALLTLAKLAWSRVHSGPAYALRSSVTTSKATSHRCIAGIEESRAPIGPISFPRPISILLAVSRL